MDTQLSYLKGSILHRLCESEVKVAPSLRHRHHGNFSSPFGRWPLRTPPFSIGKMVISWDFLGCLVCQLGERHSNYYYRWWYFKCQTSIFRIHGIYKAANNMGGWVPHIASSPKQWWISGLRDGGILPWRAQRKWGVYGGSEVIGVPPNHQF